MKAKKKKKFSLSTLIMTILLFLGLAVMFYPSFSDWWNSRVQTQVVGNYDQIVSQIDDSELERMMAEARSFNARLAEMYAPLSSTDELTDYESILDITGTGIMGYVTIPVIRVELPIYHGTGESALNIAVGHMKGSSFPVGGPSTHAVLSAHRGLPSARLFTDLDKLVVGDIFTITILKEIFTYEVEEILIVLPNEVDKLAIIPDEDIVTLMTCTPYGINTHRLLVRAHRVDTEYARSVLISADCVQVDPMLVVPIISAPLLIGLVIFWMFTSTKRKNVIPMNNPLSILPGRDDSSTT